MESAPIRVLLVDDDQEDCLLTRKLLSNNGRTAFDVNWVRSRNEALEELRDPYAVCLVDYRLGADSGLELIERAIADGFSGPMILLTGRGDHEVDVEAMKAGAADYLVKDQLTPQLMERVIRHSIERKAAEMARKAMEAQLFISDRMVSMGMLAGGVAHEINNPLAYVIANLGFVGQELAGLAGRMPAQATSFADALVAIKDAQEGAERIRLIVRDLNTFSRSDDAKRGPVDVHKMLDSTANMAWNEIRHRSRLVKDFAPSTLMVEGNESRLGQVFLNLLVNAAQAITEGAAEKNEIRVVTRVERDGRIAIEVRDTGTGIPPEVRGRLFTPFFTTKPAGVGTGLGLSICHKIVSTDGGEILVESKVGIGTTFRVLLPPATIEDIKVKSQPKELPGGRRGRVLIVDDEVMLGKALRRMLAPHHDAVVVTSGKEALRLIAADGEFDVVFCDLMMPEMSGPELYGAIVATYPELAKRVVFLTGGAFTESAISFLDQTYNMRIDKPFAVGQILAVVAQFVNRR